METTIALSNEIEIQKLKNQLADERKQTSGG